MWIGAPSIPVVLLQASASLIASVVARSHLSVCPLSLESVCHLSVYSGAAARTHKSRRGGRWARVGAIGPGDPGVRVAQRWVLVGSVRGPRELRGTPRRGRCWRAVSPKSGNRLSSGVVRIEVEVVVARIGGVRHASRTFGLHMGVGVMLRADRVAKITRSHSVSSFLHFRV